MDIHKWLNETELPHQPPSPPGQRDDHRVSCPRPPERTSREKRGRKSISDSSLLDAPPPRKKLVLADQQDKVDDYLHENGSMDASHATRRSGSSVSSQPYKRKPRRRTRPERYEPKNAKERGTHIPRRQKGESKKTRCKSRRRKADKPGSGLVQSFQAKNVPRDRLTLKPSEKLGLFSKGRVSSPVKSRGLPDLVFSEMRFLQKQKDPSEVGPQPRSPKKKKRKRDQAHVKEEEISAYFTSVRPALAEWDSSAQAKEVSHQNLRGIDRSERERSSIVDKAIPTVELVDKTSYLVFGERGPLHKDGSYISWSESIRAPSATPARRGIESIVNSGQLDPTNSGQKARSTDSGGVLHSPSAPPTATRPLTDGHGGRFHVSSLPVTNERPSRSHSLPQHTFSPRRINLVDQDARRRILETAVSPSLMPPFVSNPSDYRDGQSHKPHVPIISELRDSSLSVQPTDPTKHRVGSLERRTEHAVQDEGGQQSSSSLERILQECNAAFHERHRSEALQPHVQEPSLGVPVQSIPRLAFQSYPNIRRIPSVRFAGVEEIYRSRAPTLPDPSIYEQQEQRQYGQADPILDPKRTMPMTNVAQDEFFDEEELYYDEQNGDKEAGLVNHSNGLDLFGDEVEAQEMDPSITKRKQSQAYVVAKPGFWRPHKLY